jgi:hypothetical protein
MNENRGLLNKPFLKALISARIAHKTSTTLLRWYINRTELSNRAVASVETLIRLLASIRDNELSTKCGF